MPSHCSCLFKFKLNEQSVILNTDKLSFFSSKNCINYRQYFTWQHCNFITDYEGSFHIHFVSKNILAYILHTGFCAALPISPVIVVWEFEKYFQTLPPRAHTVTPGHKFSSPELCKGCLRMGNLQGRVRPPSGADSDKGLLLHCLLTLLKSIIHPTYTPIKSV